MNAKERNQQLIKSLERNVWGVLEDLNKNLTPNQLLEFKVWWAGTEQVVDYQPLKPEFRTENMLRELRKKLDEYQTLDNR